MCKSHFFWYFRCFAKGAMILLRSWSTLYIAVSKCKVSWFYFFYFNLPVLAESAYIKVNFSRNFKCSTKEAVILLLSLSTLYIAFSKCIVSWFYFFDFDLRLFTQSVCIRVIYSWNFRFCAKEAVLLFLSWSTMDIAFSKCKVSWF